jgi:hypothetical protein
MLPGHEPEPPLWEPSLSYGTAWFYAYSMSISSMLMIPILPVHIVLIL